MDDEFKDLQRLLRLKCHEAPPPDYFEDFLVDFHRRQRAELLKRPLWRLMFDRLEGALPSFTPSHSAYAGACATAIAATVLASSHILATGPVGTAVAETRQVDVVPATTSMPHAPAGVVRVVSNRVPANNPSRINILNASRPSVRLSPELDFNSPRPMPASYTSSRPRYVLDTQPVSYDKPFSF